MKKEGFYVTGTFHKGVCSDGLIYRFCFISDPRPAFSNTNTLTDGGGSEDVRGRIVKAQCVFLQKSSEVWEDKSANQD